MIGLRGLEALPGLTRRAGGVVAAREPETLLLVGADTDWDTAQLDASDAFWRTARAILGSDFLVWLAFGPDLTRALRAIRMQASVPSLLTLTGVNLLSGDYAATGASGGIKGDGSTKYLTSTLTQGNVGITSAAGFIAMYGNKEASATVAGAYGGTSVGTGDSQLARFNSGGSGENALRVSSTSFVADTTGTAVPAWFASSRYDASNVRRMRDATVDVVALAGATPSAGTISIMARGAGGIPTAERMKFSAIGGRALPQADMEALRTAVIAFNTALSRATA